MEAFIKKMNTGAIGPIIERTYRASHPRQWIRELAVNAQEAGAKNIYFTTEWEAVRELGIHRRLVWDDGDGMTADEMEWFLNTYGGGKRPIGEAHENFGVGFKTSALPWNKHGIVVISVKDGLESMIVLRYVEKDSNYGAVIFDDLEDEDGNTVQGIVCEPGEYEGIDYSKVVPTRIRELGHGTVTVFLGNTGTEDTILGDPSRPIEATKYWWGYVNERFYDLTGELTITIREYANHENKAKWPTKDDQIGGTTSKTLWGQNRSVPGIRPAIKRADRFTVAAEGSVDVTSEDGITARVDWVIVAPPAGKTSISEGNAGMVAPSTCAAVYRGELYDFVKTGMQAVARFDRFGLYHVAVRKQVFLFVTPTEWTAGRTHGVYPDESRSRLLVSPSGSNLPWDDWGADFRLKMPKELQDLIKEHEPKASPSGRRRLTKLAEEWHERFKLTRLMLETKGKVTTIPTHTAKSASTAGPLVASQTSTEDSDPPVHTGRKIVRRRKAVRRARTLEKGTDPHSGDAETATGSPARPLEHRSDLPEVQWASASEFAEYNPATAIAGKFVATAGPTGTVMLNEDWVVYVTIKDEILRKHSAIYDADDLVTVVKTELGTIILSKIAHALMMFDRLSPTDRDLSLSAYAITTALSGFYAEEQIIASAIGGLTKKRFKTPVAV